MMVVQGYVVQASKVRPKDMISKGVSFVAFVCRFDKQRGQLRDVHPSHLDCCSQL